MVLHCNSIIFTLTILLCITIVETNSLSLHNHNNARRRLLTETCIIINSCCISIFQYPLQSDAAVVRGAAELDLEYYIRDLIGGNRKEGTVVPSQLPPPIPPRTLLNPILSLQLLNDDNCSSDCITTKTLIETIVTRNALIDINDDNGKNGNKDYNSFQLSIEKKIQERMNDYRSRASKSFYVREPWTVQSVTDQYYFDITSYALWRTAADLLPKYPDRDIFVRALGQEIYKKLTLEFGVILKQDTAATITTGSKDVGLLVDSIPSLITILDLFKKSNCCTSYRVGEESNVQSVVSRKGNDNKDNVEEKRRTMMMMVFDEYDDETIQNGGTVNCLISIIDPMTLGSSLQIIGEQSRFAPDYIGPTIAAMWEQKYNIQSTWETYFVDPIYRPNPKDYFPNEQLYQFSLILKR